MSKYGGIDHSGLEALYASAPRGPDRVVSSTLPDLHDLEGYGSLYELEQAIADGTYYKPTKPYEADLQRARDNTRQWVESLPPGSMSGGQIIKPEYWDDEVHGPYEPDGLSPEEKNLLYQEAERELAGYTRDDFERLHEQREQQAETADAMWSEFQRVYPELSGDPAAVRAAVARVNVDLDRRFDRNIGVGEFVDRVATEIEYPTEPTGAPVNNNRTTSVFGGGGYSGGGGQREQDQPGDMLSELRAEQKRWGIR